jgi:hypothetical protein
MNFIRRGGTKDDDDDKVKVVVKGIKIKLMVLMGHMPR